MTKLTREDVLRIVGPLDDFRIARIIGTGATAAQLTEAFEWLAQEDDYLGAELRRPLAGTIAELLAILRADEPAAPDER
jgi:hypothetical protein